MKENSLYIRNIKCLYGVIWHPLLVELKAACSSVSYVLYGWRKHLLHPTHNIVTKVGQIKSLKIYCKCFCGLVSKSKRSRALSQNTLQSQPPLRNSLH